MATIGSLYPALAPQRMCAFRRDLPSQTLKKKPITIVKCALFIAKQNNGKLGDVCQDIWHVPRRDSQCRSVRPVSLVVFWTDQKPREKTSKLPLETILVPLSHSRISIHLKTGIYIDARLYGSSGKTTGIEVYLGWRRGFRGGKILRTTVSRAME